MDHLIVSGINFHNTPIAVRERLIIPESCLKHALEALKRFPHIKEAAVLSTCNRTEVYAVVSDAAAGLREIDVFFRSVQTITDHGVLKPNFRLLRDDVALHLLRVASGLDSMVLGEGQIMAQVKGAYQEAVEARAIGPVLDSLFKLALTCGKRVRTETSMGRRAVSVSSAAVELAREQLGPLGGRNIAIIGAGRMAQICVKHLLGDAGAGKVFLLNRTQDRIEKFLENSLPNRERVYSDFSFDEKEQLAAVSDLVIVSTSAHSHILKKEQLAAHRKDDSKPLVVIDISVPRNVEPEVGEIPGVKLFHADDLAAVVSKNLKEREALVADAEKIVFEMLDEFHKWQRTLFVVPTIADLREKIEAIRQEQIAKTQPFTDLCPETGRKQAEEISRAIVNQILHQPTIQLKATRDYEILKQQAEALRTLFSLDPLEEPDGQPRRRRTQQQPIKR